MKDEAAEPRWSRSIQIEDRPRVEEWFQHIRNRLTNEEWIRVNAWLGMVSNSRQSFKVFVPLNADRRVNIIFELTWG